jgi:hypothetical protein
MPFAISGFIEATKTAIDESISAEEFAAIQASENDLLIALGAEEKFAIVADNLNEFERELLQATQNHILSSDSGYVLAMNVRREIDRRLVNLLSACRLYFDQIAHLVSSAFGSTSPEEKRVNDKRHDLYDHSFAYRIMEALRNYLQHRGLPIENISFSRHRVESAGGVFWEASVIPRLSADVLEADSKFKKEVLKELKERGGVLDIRPIAREYVSRIFGVHRLIRELIGGRAEGGAELLRKWISRYAGALFLEAIEKGEHGEAIQQIQLFGEFIDHYEDLKSKFRNLDLLPQLYVSSGPEKK